MDLPQFTSYESKGQPVLAPGAFLQRWSVNILYAVLFSMVSLLIGMAGYHFTEKMAWLDAFANASMILSGMGPLASPQTTGGKLFAGTYALYSGLAFIVTTGVILSPVAHRVLHKFHAENDNDEDKNEDSGK